MVHKPGHDEVRRFILTSVQDHSADIATFTASHFQISRQAVSRHLRKLVDAGELVARGETRRRVYELRVLRHWKDTFALDGMLEEDRVWTNFVAPLVNDLPDEIQTLCHYGLTEMVNNAIDHSNGSLVRIELIRTAAIVELSVVDNGIGIFKKIGDALNLTDPRDAVIELAKGKFTTDPSRHTGEGIFFRTRVRRPWINEPRPSGSGRNR
ncbi:MAG: ArsR family transcriptional regulator [Planctomycetes bacterium]|nr:ArsR family transcriptional regulator [Planctomycetota bacterium]